MQIPSGRYTLIYPNAQYRTLRIKIVSKGNLEGRTILSLKNGIEYIGCGFLDRNNHINFWRRFREANPPERLQRIQLAIDRVAQDPMKAGMAFAMTEKCCSRCGRELSVPASLYRGLGPECAQKGHWVKADHQAVYDDLAMKNAFAAREREQEEMAFMSDPDFQQFQRRSA